MKRLRGTSAAFISVCLMSLAACGGGDSASTAGSVPAASPTSAAPPSPAAAGNAGGANDRKLCESANKAGEAMKKDFLAALKAGGGEPSPAAVKKALDDLNQKLTTAAAEGDSQVTAAMKQVGAEASKAAAAANPLEAADNPDFVKAGENLTEACKAAGVKVNF